MTQRRVCLIETLAYAPGLLPFQAWDVIATHRTVYARDATDHPSANDLYFAGVDLESLTPAPLDRTDLDLSRPGAPDDRRIAKALVARTYEDESVAYLLGPKDSGISAALAGIAAEHDVEIELVLIAQQPLGGELLHATAVVARLRDPDGGCPWDLAQDHQSLLRHLTEETYELVDAIESADDDAIREELGDVLLQVLLHAQIATDRKAFGIDVVADELTKKLIRRHPHVFAGATADTPADVEQNWETLKAREKATDDVFDGVPNAAPGLQLVTQLQSRAAKRGYERAQHLSSQTNPIDTVIRAWFTDNPTANAYLFGEILDVLIAHARSHDIDPDAAARAYATRFRTQFEAAFTQLGAAGDTASQAQWEAELQAVQATSDDTDANEESTDE